MANLMTAAEARIHVSKNIQYNSFISMVMDEIAEASPGTTEVMVEVPEPNENQEDHFFRHMEECKSWLAEAGYGVTLMKTSNRYQLKVTF